MTVTNLDGGSAELTLRGTAGEIEQLRSAINNATDHAWRAETDEPSTSSSGDRGGLQHDPETSAALDAEAAPGISSDDNPLGPDGQDGLGDAGPVDPPHGRSSADNSGMLNLGSETGESHGPSRLGEPQGDRPDVESGSNVLGGPDSDEATPGDSGGPCCDGGSGDGVGVQPRRGRLQLQAALQLLTRATGGGGSARALVTVVIDWATFGLEVERFAAGTAPPVDVFAPGFRCATIDGHRVPPSEAFALALQGEIQRCVIGAPSHKIDLGHNQRLFNAAGRQAVRVRDQTCVHPNCDLPSVWAITSANTNSSR